MASTLVRETPIERVAYGLAEAAEAVGLGLTSMTELVSSGRVRSWRYGRRILILKQDLQAFAVQECERQNGGT